MTLEIAETGDRFLRAGRPTFLLGDTVWAAFARISPSEWGPYLRLRRRQGFNALYISVLPIIGDRTIGDEDHPPFRTRGSGEWDLDRLDPAYFTRARAMVEAAATEGFTCFLVLLWHEYVPSTRARLPRSVVLNEEQTERYIDLAVDTFEAYDPVFVISGDDGFEHPAAIERYTVALHRVKATAPHCLTTLHSTPSATVPGSLADSDDLDFYSYQSGHQHTSQHLSWELATGYLGRTVRRPIIDMEPCYEGHGSGTGSGRHGRADIRFASWGAILAGASAGLGYGAHGVWSWHRRAEPFTSEPFSGLPFPADIALGLPGAWDAGFARHLIEDHSLFGIGPRQELLAGDTHGARAGATADQKTTLIYAPHAFRLALNQDLSGYQVCAWDLADRRPEHPRLSDGPNGTIIEQPEFPGDALYLFTR